MKPPPRKHPAKRLYAWHAYDGTLCICCCECGKVLRGGLGYVDTPKPGKVNPYETITKEP